MDASKLGKASSSEEYWNPDLGAAVTADVKQVESVAADVNAEVTKRVTAKVTAEVTAEVTKVGVPAEITAVNTRRDPFNMGPWPCFD